MQPELALPPVSPEPTARWTSGRIRHLLQERHPSKEWAFFAELSDGTGTYKSRSFDAFALHLWPSKGFRAVGYEIKVSRADFAKEIADPSKRGALEAVAGECFFAMPAGLVRVDEIPEGWGLIEATTGGLRVKKQPTQRKIESYSMTFVASLARRSADPDPRVPAAVWDWAGRKLTLAALDKLLDARGGQLLQRLQNARCEQAAPVGTTPKRTNHLADLRLAVVDALGWSAGTAEGFRRALEAGGMGELSGEVRARLRRLAAEAQALADGRPSMLLELREGR